VQAVGIERTAVSRYLSILRELHLVERRLPATETQPQKSRKGIYRLRDPFLRFWFRFVAPRISTLETGLTSPTAKRVGEELSQFVDPAFEDLCRDWILERAAIGDLPFELERVGSWWDRDREVDIVGIGPKVLLLGECKWRRRPVGVTVLDNLDRTGNPLVAELRPRRVVRIVFSRAGFTPALAARAEADDDLRLVAAERLMDPPRHDV
jgi:AAA+ ATPase superfamily predicted ATPase